MRMALLLLTVLLLGADAAPPGKKPTLDPNQPCQAQRSNPVTYDVDFSVVVTPPYRAKVLKVWLPLPQSDGAQTVEEKDLTTLPVDVKPQIAAEPRFGNKFAYFQFDNAHGAQLIRHRFKVTVWEQRWNVDPARVSNVAEWPASFAPYLRSDQSVVVDDRFRKLARDIVPEPNDRGRDLVAVLDWVNKTMKYDHNNGSLRGSSEHALTHKAGHCSDYHGLCAALGRAIGYPTRVTYGINPFPKNSPSHCKVEVFLPPYGWVCFDLSETQNLVSLIKKSDELNAEQKAKLVEAATDRLRRGFRDNTWFLQTRGTDYDLAPPASKRVPLVRTIYAEADGVALPEPDPANADKREFAWMTVHRYVPDKPVTYPFKDWKSLLPPAMGR